MTQRMKRCKILRTRHPIRTCKRLVYDVVGLWRRPHRHLELRLVHLEQLAPRGRWRDGHPHRAEPIITRKIVVSSWDPFVTLLTRPARSALVCRKPQSS